VTGAVPDAGAAPDAAAGPAGDAVPIFTRFSHGLLLSEDTFVSPFPTRLVLIKDFE